jgi:hypothetical protein
MAPLEGFQIDLWPRFVMPRDGSAILADVWRLEPERAPLVRPRHRKIHETFETETSRQTTFDCRLDDIRRKESERQGHPNRTLSLAFSRSQRLQSLARLGQKFVEPTMGVAKSFDQDRARVGRLQSGQGRGRLGGGGRRRYAWSPSAQSCGAYGRSRRSKVSAGHDDSRLNGSGIDHQEQHGSGASSSRRERPPLPTLAGFELIAEDVASHDGSLSTLR